MAAARPAVVDGRGDRARDHGRGGAEPWRRVGALSIADAVSRAAWARDGVGAAPCPRARSRTAASAARRPDQPSSRRGFAAAARSDEWGPAACRRSARSSWSTEPARAAAEDCSRRSRTATTPRVARRALQRPRPSTGSADRASAPSRARRPPRRSAARAGDRLGLDPSAHRDEPRDARVLPREQLAREHAPRVLIPRRRRRTARELLGRHVRRRPAHAAFLRLETLLRRVCVRGRAGDVDAERLGEPEVEHAHLALGRDHHVVGLRVAMDEPGFVRRAKRARDLNEPRELVAFANLGHADPIAQRLALDEVHAHERVVTLFADVVHRDDVRMAERRGRARFAEQTFGAAVASRNDLERDPPLQDGVPRAIDLAHSTRAELILDAVSADREARLEHPPSVAPKFALGVYRASSIASV